MRTPVLNHTSSLGQLTRSNTSMAHTTCFVCQSAVFSFRRVYGLEVSKPREISAPRRLASRFLSTQLLVGASLGHTSYVLAHANKIHRPQPASIPLSRSICWRSRQFSRPTVAMHEFQVLVNHPNHPPTHYKPTRIGKYSQAYVCSALEFTGLDDPLIKEPWANLLYETAFSA